MRETKLYYLGTGTEFVKAQCKEYKTIEGVLKAASKEESLVAWDADGNVMSSLTDNVHDGTSKEEQQNTQQDGTQQGNDGQNDAVGTNAQTNTTNDENGQNEENTTLQDDNDEQETGQREENKEEIGRFRVEVICEGSLRLRRSATFEIDNECGRASKGQTYIGKRIFMSDGLPMLETIDGLFLSAAAEHVKIDKMES